MIRPRLTPPAPALAAVLLAAVTLSACGGGTTERGSIPSRAAVTPVPAAPTGDPSAVPARTPVPSVAVAPSGPAPEAPGDVTGGGAAAPGTARSVPPPVVAAPPAGRSAAPAAPAPRAAAANRPATRAGRYTYDSRGTVTAGAAPRDVSGTAVLAVEPAVRDTQRAVLEGDQGRTETDTLLRPDGRYVARLQLTTPAFSKEFVPSPAALLLPEPAAVGRSWSWRATSTDGRTTVSTANRILREGSVVVGGTRVRTLVVETRLTLRGDVTYDGTTTTDYAPEHRLAVRDRGTGRGTVNGVPFSTDTTSTLRSVEPA